MLNLDKAAVEDSFIDVDKNNNFKKVNEMSFASEVWIEFD